MGKTRKTAKSGPKTAYFGGEIGKKFQIFVQKIAEVFAELFFAEVFAELFAELFAEESFCSSRKNAKTLCDLVAEKMQKLFATEKMQKLCAIGDLEIW